MIIYKFNNIIYNTLESVIDIALPILRTDNNGRLKPMKAQSYFKDNGDVRIVFPAFAQPKLNGFRVICRWEEVEEGEGIFKTKVEKPVFRSKEGLRYDILEHIENEFTKDMFFLEEAKSVNDITYTQLAFDGEMYIHGEILSEISSAVRKRNPKTNTLKFYVFDIAIENRKQDKRIQILDLLKGNIIQRNIKNIEVVNTVIIQSNEEAQAFTDECIKQGYEGAIFRDMKAEYKFGSRPTTMTKLKRYMDKEYQIVDIIEGENAPGLGIFRCIVDDKLFDVMPEASHEKRKEYLINKSKYIGKPLTVRFFEYTKNGIPFHGKGIDIRDYE